MLCDDTDFCMNYQYNPLTDYDIIVRESYSKYNETIECDNTVKHCSVYCIGSNSCAFSNIICPANNINATCSIYCGTYGCSHSTITANNISSLTLETKSSYGLEYTDIVTSYLNLIEINCNHGYSCQYMKLTAANIDVIDVQCLGTYSCRGSNMMYVSDGDYNIGFQYPVDFDLDCYGYYSCSSSTINSNSGYINLACNSDSANTDGCYDVSLFCPKSTVLTDENDANLYCAVLCGKTDSCINLDVYAINGWNNVRVSSINDQYPSSATMHCDPAFSQQCIMQGHVNSNEWFCDTAEICSNYRLDLTSTHMMTTKSYEHYNKTINCELNKECYIYCTKTSSCKYSVINCGNANCSLFCYGIDSCAYSEIMAYDSKLLYIYSSGSNAASYSTIYAPNNGLSMICTGSYSCRYQQLFLSNTDQINIQCMSSFSCANQIIYAENTNQFYQKCVNSYSCAYSALYQYLSSASAIGIDFDCLGSYSCYQSSIKASIPLNVMCENDNSCNALNAFIPKEHSFELLCVSDKSCFDINIYSLQGFVNSNVNITSYVDSYANSAKFYCGNGYNKYCELNGLINSDQWICADTTNDCYDFTFREDNTDYIVLKYSRKYAYDYVICDQDKINCDVSCAQYGCWNSKIVCPTNSTNSACSIYCSPTYSCTNLDIYAFNGYPMVDLDCNNNNNYCTGITIYCTDHFNESCVMNSNGECVGFCSNYTYIGTAQTSVNIDFSLHHSYPNDSYIVASNSYQYYNNTVTCVGDLNMQCTIKCANSYTCQRANIIFIGNNLSCNLLCQSSLSCESSEINGNNCLSLNIHGSGSSSLSSAVINPSNIETLNIVCSGSYACQYVKVYQENDDEKLSSSLQIYQSCIGNRACRYQFWSVHIAQSITIECISGYSCANSQYYQYSLDTTLLSCEGSDSCSSSIMKTEASHVLIECASDDACLNMKMYVPVSSIINCSDAGGCESLNIYTVGGSNSLNITSTDNNSLVTSNRLYCTETYIESCVLQNDGLNRWNCDVNNICYEFLENRHVIHTEYTYQFYNDGIICDDNRNCDIACTHQYACQYSQITCPDNYNCNIFCGYYGCQYATINTGNNANLNLICYGGYGCANSIIYGMETTLSMNVECKDSYSCGYMQIFGEFVNDVSMDCSGYYGCRYAKVYQHSLSTTDVTSNTYVNCQGQYSCQYGLFNTNAFSSAIICNKDQQNDYACNSMNIYHNRQNENGIKILCDNIQSCMNNKYYVLGGEYGANITTFAVTNAETNKLFCCESWIESCTLKGQVFSEELICNDRNSVCADTGNHCPSKHTSNILNIIQQYQYYNESIYCNDNGMDCNIICQAPYSCNYANIYCVAGYNCNIYCYNQYACSHAIIHAESAASLSIVASGTHSLEYSTIYGPVGQQPFQLQCGYYACHNAKIDAPYSYIDSLRCYGDYSCNTMRISVEYSSYIDWMCQGSYSCRDIMVWHHDKLADYFAMHCEGYYACDDLYAIVSAQNVNINCKSGINTCGDAKIFCKSEQTCTITCETQQACNLMHIYAVEPANTLTVIRGDIEYEPNVVLHCGVRYENQCTLQPNNESNTLLCGESHICSNYQLNYDTTDYIVYQWAYWNYKQNVTCNQSKSNCEIYCSGSSSCRFNNIKCSSNTNGYCKIFCGSSGCRDSIIYADSVASVETIAAGTYAFGTTDLNIAAGIINLDCSYDYGCSSMNLLLLSSDTTLTMNCPSSYSCQSSNVFASNTSVDASISCGGHASCRYLDGYFVNAKQLYINCHGSYACQQEKIYSSKALTFDTLDCGTSTSCRSLVTYCSYPSLDNLCAMEYETVSDLWFCEGDICFYDDECEDYTGLAISPKAGSILGEDTIMVTGPCYNPNINYTCKFGTRAVELHLLNSTHAYCVSPPSDERGNVLFAVHEDNEWYGMISTFHYNNLYDDYDIIIDPPIEFLYNDTMVNITWDMTDIQRNLVDIKLYQIIPYIGLKGEMLSKARFLMNLQSNILNNGSSIVYLNNTHISLLNVSADWDIIYGNLSEISNIIIVAVESSDTHYRRRIASNYIQQLYPEYNSTLSARRRTIGLGAIAVGLANKFAIRYIGCKVWKLLDEQIYGDWWRDAGLPRCPERDPSDRIADPRCEGPWEPDPACQDGSIGCMVFHTGAHNCVRSAGGQQCCYTQDGALCTDPPCGGTVDMSPVSQGTVSHFFVDVFPYALCRSSGLIDDYYDRRPSNPNTNRDGRNGGRGERAGEACAPAGGDPHFVTFDLFNYTFNGIGDYYYLYNDNFKIIVRMEKFKNGSVMTQLGLDINTESLIGFNRSQNAIINTLEVVINEGNNLLDIYINGEIMLFSGDMYGMNIAIGDISINYGGSEIIIRCAFGLFLEIWLRNIEDQLLYIEFTVDVDSKYQGQVSGLTGNYDDSTENDLYTRDGAILPSYSTIKEIHYDFGLSWLLNDNDNNIFHNEFLSDINPYNYKPLFGFDEIDSNLLDIATEQCGTEFSCIYDVVATELVAIANTTLELVQFTKDSAETIKMLYNVTEIITPSPTLEGCYLEESMNLYLIVDANCNITQSQCIDQQLFVASFLENIKSKENNDIEQLFGYIEYGNGANKLFSLNDEINNDFNSMTQTIKSITECNNLQGAINHPYYGIQTAMDDFKNIDNDYNNIIVIISGCSPYEPSSKIDHTCLLKQEFDDENINLFVVNNNNNNSYECLVNDMNRIFNINEWILSDNIINNICSWIEITTNIDDIEEKNFKQILEKYFILIFVTIIFICLLCVIFHWVYIYKLKKSNSTKVVKRGSVEMNKNNVDFTLSNKYHHTKEYSETTSMQRTNIQGTKASTNFVMHPITENDNETDYI